MTAQPPILVLADDGPSVFETIEEVERRLEPIDVRNGEYRVFDAEGFPLELSTTTRSRAGLFGGEIEVTRVGPRTGASRGSEVTREILDWLTANYPDRRPEISAELSAALAQLVEWFGYER